MTTSSIEWCVVLDGSSIPDRDDIGNKARGIALMRSQGLPVPAAFVLPTHVGRRYLDAGNALPDEAWEATVAAVHALEAQTDRKFASTETPLLVSVRSGAAQSMPGMMDTILNLGITDEIEAAIAAESGDADFARNTHLRFLEAYAKTVLGKKVAHAETPAAMREAIAAATGRPVPEDPYEQLQGAIGAVFSSWTSPRAQAYRRHWGIPEEGGTAVTVQAMVFGNLDDKSGTGVFFTRNPHSGERRPYGEFLPRGQGEDVVSGEVQPLDLEALRERMPEVHAALLEAGQTLEHDAGDVQDIEFTVERGRLYLLQTRSAKRSPAAAIRLAVDLVEDGLALAERVLHTIRKDHLEAVLKPTIDPDQRAGAEVLAKGEPACPGIAAGMAVADADEAESISEDGTEVVLVTKATSPEDIHGMIAATGIVTEIGGRTSHAAVVSRELGRPAVVGCGAGAVERLMGKMITIDGETGEVFAGELAMRTPVASEHPHLAKLTAWAAEHRDKLDADHPLLAHLPHLPQG
jgi:pyruvate,orthophosphate dikinase